MGIIRRVREDGPDGGGADLKILPRSVEYAIRGLMDEVRTTSFRQSLLAGMRCCLMQKRCRHDGFEHSFDPASSCNHPTSIPCLSHGAFAASSEQLVGGRALLRLRGWLTELHANACVAFDLLSSPDPSPYTLISSSGYGNSNPDPILTSLLCTV